MFISSNYQICTKKSFTFGVCDRLIDTSLVNITVPPSMYEFSVSVSLIKSFDVGVLVL